jgi:hypothetical protein
MSAALGIALAGIALTVVFLSASNAQKMTALPGPDGAPARPVCPYPQVCEVDVSS